jgi:superfamily I DNA/RNA helicase
LPAVKIVEIIQKLNEPVILLGGPDDVERAEEVIRQTTNFPVPEPVEGTIREFGTSTSSVTEISQKLNNSTTQQLSNSATQQLNISFLANGDMIEITRINKFEEMYGFHFADVDIQLMDYEDAPTLSVKIIMETLYSDSPALTNEEAKRLYQAVEEDYMDIPRAADRRKAMKENPYYNALQVKFGYALTCHKTQGGQWNNVFVEAPYLPDETTLELGDLRWLYTAMTRAKEKVYLVNFKEEWFY